MEAIFAFILILISQLFGTVSENVSPGNDDSDWETQTAQVLSVVDGDTIKVRVDGVDEVVRYIGVDTPEPYRDGEPACYSKEASEKNRTLVEGREVKLVSDQEDRDRFNRLLRYVYVDDVFVNQQLVEQGFATTLPIRPNTKFASDLAKAQNIAKSEKIGLWSACSDDSTNQTDEVPTDDVVVNDSQLSDGQKRMLKFLGIDASVFTITSEMVTCATDAVGFDRLGEITAGELPSIAEGVKLLGCYQT